jgi:hypothetical protein
MRVAPRHRPFFLLSVVAIAAAVSLQCERQEDPLDLSRFPALDKLTLPSTAKSTEWLEKSRITHLDVSGTLITSLSRVPPRLTYLRARNLLFGSLDLSDTGIVTLDLLDTHIGGRTKLPPLTQSLSAEGDVLKKLPTLPPNLRTLVIGRALLKDFTVPQGVQRLILIFPSASTWRTDLPETLTSLSIENDSLEAVPDLPASISRLSLARTSSLDEPLKIKAPARINALRLHGGAIVENWPDFADALLDLDLLATTYPEGLDQLRILSLSSPDGNKPLFIRRWPSGLKQLSLANFSEGFAPTLPKSIQNLNLTRSDLVLLGDFAAEAKALESLNLEDWATVDLAQIPRSVKALNLSGVGKIINPSGLPPGLLELTCERCRHQDLLKSLPSTIERLDIDESRGITAIPNLPSLKSLSIRASDVREIAPETLAHLIELDFCGSSVDQLSGSPSHLKMLALTKEQLEPISRLPELEVLVVRERKDECSDDIYSAWRDGSGN